MLLFYSAKALHQIRRVQQNRKINEINTKISQLTQKTKTCLQRLLPKVNKSNQGGRYRLWWFKLLDRKSKIYSDLVSSTPPTKPSTSDTDTGLHQWYNSLPFMWITMVLFNIWNNIPTVLTRSGERNNINLFNRVQEREWSERVINVYVM